MAIDRTKVNPADNEPVNDIELTEQEILNKSFDKTFNTIAVELLGLGPDGRLKRLATDLSGGLNVDINMATEGIATSANQTSGGQKTQVVDSGGAELEMIKEQDMYNAANHGLITYGLNRAENPKKYYQINVDSDGHQKIHLVDTAGNEIDPATKEIYSLLYATEYGTTYNYIMRYTRGTTNWEIQRETVASGLREYSRGTNALATGWSGRAGLTYGA